MKSLTRSASAALSFCLPALVAAATTFGQQLGPPQAVPVPGAQPQAPAAPQVPAGFQLNALQDAALNQALDAWQVESGKTVTFSCEFERLEYVMAFGPVINGQVRAAQ